MNCVCVGHAISVNLELGAMAQPGAKCDLRSASPELRFGGLKSKA